MTLDELITKLEKKRDEVGGDTEVQAYSANWCMDIHKIVDVTDGWFDGWRVHDNVVGIEIDR